MTIQQLAPQNLAEFLKERPDTVLLDVREPWEHERAAIQNSVLLPLGQVATGVEDELPGKSTPVVVYCHHGMRSLQACSLMAGLGYTRLFNLAGGIDRYSIEVDRSVPRY